MRVKRDGATSSHEFGLTSGVRATFRRAPDLRTRAVEQSVCSGQHPKGSTLKGHGRPRQVHVVSETKAGRDRQRGHALGVHATFAGETEELIEELLNPVAWSEGDAHSGRGATV